MWSGRPEALAEIILFPLPEIVSSLLSYLLFIFAEVIQPLSSNHNSTSGRRRRSLPSLLCAARLVQSAAIAARLYVTLSKQVSEDRVCFQRCRNTAAPLALPCNLSAGPSRRRQSSTRPGHSARSAPLFGVSGEAARRNRVGFALSVCALALECHLICGRAPHSGSSNFLPFPPTPQPPPPPATARDSSALAVAL